MRSIRIEKTERALEVRDTMIRSTRQVIALCGRAGSGKDSFALPFLDAGFVHMKFAQPLKDTLLLLFPHMDARHIEGELKDSVDSVTGATPRELMQFIGTDLLQHGLKTSFPGIGRRIFADALVRRANCERYRHENVVITDMRFMHELEAARSLVADGSEVVVVKVIRHTQTNDTKPVASEHESEIPIDDGECDVVIHNDDTIERLRAYAKTILARALHL